MQRRARDRVVQGAVARPKRPKLRILPYAERQPGPRVEVSRLDEGHPLFSMEPHGHGFFELVYVERGRGTHRLGASSASVRPGDLLVVAPGEAHDARAMKDVRGWLVVFDADALGPRASTLGGLPDEVLLLAFVRPARGERGHLRVPPRERAALAFEIAMLARELERRELGWMDAARARLALVLVRASRLAAPLLEGVTVQRRPLIGEVFRFIEARYMRPITLVDVARAVGKSPAYLTDVVRRETGRTVGAWILERRMAEARRRLVETDDSVAEIAEALGYDDESYFARRFRAHFETSPSAYRARHR